MTQLWLLLLSAALLGLTGPTVAEDGFTSGEAEAAREGLQEALGDALTRSSFKLDELDLPPSISESVRRVAFVKVDTVKEAKNIRMHRLGTVRKAGVIGVDPLEAGKTISFTFPIELDTPHITGELVRKVNDVGPTGHFNTTIGVYRMEVEGTATVSKNTCAFNFTEIKDVSLDNVDTTVEGASLLNRVLASEMSTAVRSGAVSIKEPVAKHILERLQYEQEDCSKNVKASISRLAANPAPAAPPAAAPAAALAAAPAAAPAAALAAAPAAAPAANSTAA